MKPATARHPGIFRALGRAKVGSMVDRLHAWAREHEIRPSAIRAAIEFRRDHASQLGERQVQLLAERFHQEAERNEQTGFDLCREHTYPECPRCGASTERP